MLEMKKKNSRIWCKPPGRSSAPAPHMSKLVDSYERCKSGPYVIMLQIFMYEPTAEKIIRTSTSESGTRVERLVVYGASGDVIEMGDKFNEMTDKWAKCLIKNGVSMSVATTWLSWSAGVLYIDRATQYEAIRKDGKVSMEYLNEIKQEAELLCLKSGVKNNVKKASPVVL